ncbi:MAG: hypothetical protein J0L84_14025 [Verrucomicrobia bacterium]|nr:hypothetical protein [Verrucomicrobiota bacterium]
MAETGKPPTTLLFFAVPEEARPFIRRWERIRGATAPRLKGPGLAAWLLEPDGVVVQVSGMGARNARRVGLETLARHGGGAGRLLTAGFAGGLDPALRCGTVLYDADPGLVGMEEWRSAGAQPGRLVEVSRVAVTPADKARLRMQTGADAVEMESSTLRSLARERGIPSATVRVISDAADEALPLDFNALLTPEDRIHFGRLAWAIARSPASIPRLLAFQRTTAAAAESLARVLLPGNP